MVIAITGAIASGKTQVSNYIKEKYKLIDSDTISHFVFDLEETKEKIKKCFNIDVVTRKKVGDIVFKDEDKLHKLNDIMHPIIIKEINKQINECKDEVCFVDIPLLYDVKCDINFDYVIYVYANKDNQLKRLIERENIDIEFAKEKIEKQLDVEEKKRIAIQNNHFVLDNNGDLCDTFKRLDKIFGELKI